MVWFGSCVEAAEFLTQLGIPMVVYWWYTYPSEKYKSVSWDDEIPNWMESHKIHVPNHQPVSLYCFFHMV